MIKTHLILLCTICLFSVNNKMFAQGGNISPCQQAEYTALRALYLNTDGDNWNTSINWPDASTFLANQTLPANEDMSTWQGVSIGPDSSIIQLQLGLNNLAGELPDEIGDLCGLIHLLLGSNIITGGIPASISNLANLQVLDLSDNQLSSPLPVGLSNLTNLQEINIRYNSLTGSIPDDIGNINSLFNLSLQYNLLSGSIPKSLGNLSNLNSLNLGNNNLSGIIPSELGNMTSLTNLLLYNNLLIGDIPPSLVNPPLAILVLTNNELSGCYDPMLSQLCSSPTLVTNSSNSISEGNHFCFSWDDFCTTQAGVCDGTDANLYCYCETSMTLHEAPDPDFINRASFQIQSDDIIDHNLHTSYTAGNHIDLERGFYVSAGSTFDAYIEGCEEACAVTPPCEGAPCALLDVELDSNGNPYAPNQLTVVFTVAPTATINADVVDVYLDSIFYDTPGLILNPPSTLTLTEFDAATTVSKCLCNEDIYLYEVDPIYEINEEGGGDVANSTGGPKDEGPTYNVNHYVDASLNNEEEPAPSTATIPIPGVVNGDTNAPRVAILDSGVDPAVLESNSVLDMPTQNIINGSISCFAGVSGDDTFGWNFIADTEDISDLRGHGTSVYLSYLSALEKLNIQPDEQNTIIVKVLDDCGVGTAYSIACGLHYAAERRADIINASWGLYTNNFLIQNAVDDITSQDVILSCSSGNLGTDGTLVEHYPSGYGHFHSKILDLPGQVYAPSLGIESVFEVSGLCRPIGTTACLITNEDVSLWASANFRSNASIFAETAIEIQSVLGDNAPPCGIMGTSYAAPQFTAGILHWFMQNQGTPITKLDMQNESVTWDTNTGSYSSYLLANDMLCN